MLMKEKILLKNLKLDGETILSVILFLMGAAYFSLTFTFREFASFGGYSVSAKLIPRMLGIALCICTAFNVQFSIMRARSKTQEGKKQHDPAMIRDDTIRGCLTFGLMVFYVSLLHLVGFLIMSAIYVFFQILLFSKKEQQNYLVSAVVAIVSSAFVYYLFLYGFRMMLPVGLLAFL